MGHRINPYYLLGYARDGTYTKSIVESMIDGEVNSWIDISGKAIVESMINETVDYSRFTS